MIWIDILPADGPEAARRARALLDDSRVTHFQDPDQFAGRAWAQQLGLPAVAWDVYMLFDQGSVWSESAPEPREWFHQLGGYEDGAGRRRTGHALATALHGAALATGWPVSPRAPDVELWDHSREAALVRLQDTSDLDGRCSDCRAARRVSTCSTDGWRRLLMRRDGDGLFSISDAEPTDTNHRQEVRFVVSGMRCPECMLRAGAGLIFMEDVREVAVRLDGGELRIFLAQGALPNAEVLARGVRKQGYTVELIALEAAR